LIKEGEEIVHRFLILVRKRSKECWILL